MATSSTTKQVTHSFAYRITKPQQVIKANTLGALFVKRGPTHFALSLFKAIEFLRSIYSPQRNMYKNKLTHHFFPFLSSIGAPSGSCANCGLREGYVTHFREQQSCSVRIMYNMRYTSLEGRGCRTRKQSTQGI